MSRANAFHSFSLAGLSGGKIDSATGVISGVAVITKGPLRAGDARDIEIDSTTLEQIRKAANTYAGGLKVKLDHEGGAGDIIGSLQNFRVEGDVLRADLHLLSSTPHRDYVLEIASKLADTFGLSVAFSGKPETKGEQTFARCTEIYSCDLVSEPAANKNGLFSTQEDFTMTPDELKALASKIDTVCSRLDVLEKKPKKTAVGNGDAPDDPDDDQMAAKHKAHLLEVATTAAQLAFDKGAEAMFVKFGKQLGQPVPANPTPSNPAPAPANPTDEKFESIAKKHMADGKTRMEATELARKSHPKAYENYFERVQKGVIEIY